jgi:ABC-type branched-subunit amino acid transport system substrate-binding protein
MRGFGKKRKGGTLLLMAVVAGLIAALLTPVAGGASAPRAVAVEKTITTGGIGFARNFPDAGVGTEARFKRANDTNEVKGYTFELKEFADDNNDPATALAETRRLVTQEGVDAIVPNVSLATPSDFLTQQQIPWFGPGYDTTYCEPGGWGFSVYGCIILEDPKVVPGSNWEQLYTELTTKKGIDKPTVAMLATDSNSGKTAVQFTASAAQGAGFEVVYAKGVYPAPPAVVGDYAPYVQALSTANDGEAPDVVYTTIPATNTIALVNQMKTGGYTGTFLSPFYSPLLLNAFEGSYIFVQFAGFESTAKGIQQTNEDVEAVKPGAPGSIALAGGYFAADMFIQAIKDSLKTSKTLTTESIKKAAAKMTYQIKDTIGPTSYPKSYKGQFKACSTLLFDDGTEFTIAQKFFCTDKKYPVLPKFAGN